ncbi:DNA-binding transcriptional activator of the SARP family [Amycolatopsis xylanica]|uniref:DNA-binding transcriptional activator of the SARP family n=1 Tax=Amycolatopsis xylanica TaxID=589385 RepID=A0A1H2VPK6_9PSEU|nr:AfsR/SARP family transcriptional regulator [Amycolatopsis xylanica]SDW70226.1 DNA-binding transcriptional activator of the SARP family [Amycolatopsis xylanica]
MKFNILGSIQMLHEGESCTPSAPKVRRTLALLLLRTNHLVNTSSLIDELWCDNPPRSAITTTQTYIYQLRKILLRVLGEQAAAEMLLTQPPGYVLRLEDDQLDVKVFDRLAEQGRDLVARNRLEDGSRVLRAALSLWRGSALADVTAGPILESYVSHLEETRIRTLELRVQTDVRLGRYRELIPELRSLVATHPLNEWFHAQLITALRQAGRRGEALQAYQSLRRVLRDDLGLEPSQSVRRLQEDLLNGGDQQGSLATVVELPSPAERREFGSLAII